MRSICFKLYSYHGRDPGILVTQPLINFVKALELPGKHQGVDSAIAIARFDVFLSVMEVQQPGICCHFDQALANTIGTNHTAIMTIYQC